MSKLVTGLLAKRGVVVPEDAERFLNPDYARDTHDPFLLQGMEKAVGRVFAAIRGGERIAIYADFDCDGIPGAAILSDFFKKLGYPNFEVYIPHRDREGYGFHIAAIEELVTSGVSLIITVDVGTNALDAVSFAKEKGIDVIVTDHHEVTGATSSAVAVLNPKIGGYPFRDLCGAAVAWKLVQAMIERGKQEGLAGFAEIPHGWEKWLLDLVAIATVADLVPLIHENRALVHFGLKVLGKSPRVGINALCSALRLRKSELTEEHIAFSIAPRVNAASRMDEPELAFFLLTTDNSAEAKRLVARLEELNAERKVAVAQIVKAAKRVARTRFQAEESVIVLGSPEWKPALLGLAANSLMESRGGVVVMWGRDGNGVLKGSARSDGSLSVVELFSAARDSFVEFGGHEKSGGFTVSHEKVHTLHDTLASASASLASESTAIKDQGHDALITLSEVTESLLGDVSKLAPFGIGNPKPIFLVSPVRVTSLRPFGRDKNHIEVIVACERTGISVRAFDFFNAPENFKHTPTIGNPVRLLASIERDSYRGGLTLRLVDVLASASMRS